MEEKNIDFKDKMELIRKLSFTRIGTGLIIKLLKCPEALLKPAKQRQDREPQRFFIAISIVSGQMSLNQSTLAWFLRFHLLE